MTEQLDTPESQIFKVQYQMISFFLTITEIPLNIQTPISNNFILFNNYGNLPYVTNKLSCYIYFIRLMVVKVAVTSIVTIMTSNSQ